MYYTLNRRRVKIKTIEGGIYRTAWSLCAGAGHFRRVNQCGYCYKKLEFVIAVVYITRIMGWEGINKRKFPRLARKCRILVSRSDHNDVIEAVTENIGPGGICVVLDKRFDIFEGVSLEVFLDDISDPISCDGKIVWVVKSHLTHKAKAAKYDTGIEFQGISRDDREDLARLVSGK